MITGYLSEIETRLSLSDFVAKAPALSWAKLIPPLRIVNVYLRSGELRWDYHQRFVWIDQIADETAYSEMVRELESRSFMPSTHGNRPSELWAWQATQHEHRSGVNYELAAFHCKRLQELELEMKFATTKGDNDQAALLHVAYCEAVERAMADGI